MSPVRSREAQTAPALSYCSHRHVYLTEDIVQKEAGKWRLVRDLRQLEMKGSFMNRSTGERHFDVETYCDQLRRQVKFDCLAVAYEGKVLVHPPACEHENASKACADCLIKVWNRAKAEFPNPESLDPLAEQFSRCKDQSQP